MLWKRGKRKEEVPHGPPSAGQPDARMEAGRRQLAGVAALRLTKQHGGEPVRADVPQLGMQPAYLLAVSGGQFEIDYQVTDGSQVATRWSFSGRLDADLFGLAGNGQPVSVSGITITTFSARKLRQEWSYWNLQESGASGSG
jgi:hypothetical protein